MKSFNEGQYYQAVGFLEKFIKAKSQYSETANVILILSFFRLNEFEKARELIYKFEVEYPSSPSLHVVLETKLAIAIHKKDFDDIKNSILSIDKLKIKKEQFTDFLYAFKKIFSFLGDKQIYELETIISNPILKSAFLKASYQNAVENKNSAQIRLVYKDLVRTLLKNDLIKINKIGVLIPKASNSSFTENLVLEGIKFAVHRYNFLREEDIELKIYKGDHQYLEKALIELAKDPEVLCVIGPLYSEQFKNLSILADRLCIPLISPTATADDISIKSKYVFQFNPTLNLRGYAMAVYAIDKLRMSRFALLNSEAQSVKAAAKEIQNQIKNSKKELLAEIHWDGSKKSLPQKIRELRRAAFNRDLVIRFNKLLDYETEMKLISYGLSQNIIDSLKAVEGEMSIFEIFGKDAEKICQNLRISYFKRTKNIVNDFSIPLYAVDAVFIPLENDDLVADIINEIEKQNIITKIIGNDNWNSIEKLNKAYPASNGVIFTSDFYFDYDDKKFKDLSNEIYEYTALQPGRTFFYGYETANKILENWDYFLDRESFYERIISDNDYAGLSSDIILNKNGINSSVYILEYRNRKIRKIDRIIAK